MASVWTCLLALAATVTISAAVFAGEPTTKPLYENTDAALDDRVADLVSRMTLEEKASALNHKGPELTRFHLRADQWNQCLNGVQWDHPTTLFPVCLGMSATWDTPLVHDVASSLSDEARAIYNGWHQDPNFKGEHKGLIYRDPVINIGRNPYWGRNHEAFGEDPFLTGRMAVAYVKGLQGDDPRYLKVASTLKHFAVNNVEIDRTKLNANVPERWLREYWLPHFHDAVVEGGAQSLMASYNAINGTPNNINHWLLTDVLKGEWKHEGFVVSDLGGVKTMVEGHEKKQMTYVDAVAQSLMAGCDFSDIEFEKNIPEAVKTGKLTEERLNDAVRRVMRVRMRLGEFDPQEMNPYSKIPMTDIRSPEHLALSLKASHESIVLLKNADNLLPLDKSKLKRIAVIGPTADLVQLNNYNGKVSDEAVSPLKGIRDRAPSGTTVDFAVGGTLRVPPARNKPATPFDEAAELQKAVDLAKSADVALLFVGTNRQIEQEGLDRKHLDLPGNQEQLVEAVLAANPKTIVIETSAGPLTVPWIKEHVPVILQMWWGGDLGGDAIADVLFGDYNPAGRMPHTVYASEEQVPPNSEYDVSKGFTYMFVKGDPLFAFGHGLSYTKFAYSDLSLSSAKTDAAATVKVSLNVKNDGSRDGDEVVQLYVRAPGGSIVRASKELRGFARVPLKAGESHSVSFELPIQKLAYWNDQTHGWQVQSGDYEIMVGASSQDIRVKQTLTVQ